MLHGAAIMLAMSSTLDATYSWLAVLVLAGALPLFLFAWDPRRRLSPRLVLAAALVLLFCQALLWVDLLEFRRAFEQEGLTYEGWPQDLLLYLWRYRGRRVVAESVLVFCLSYSFVLVVRSLMRRMRIH